MRKMIIYLGSDHAGFALKEHIKGFLKNQNFTVRDEGAFKMDPADDYPDFIKVVAKQVGSDPDNSRGIIFGASGEGEAIAANRFPGVRACVYYGGTEEVITLSRVHNNANILSIGARFVDWATAERIIKLWLNIEFPGEERHLRRIKKIDSENRELADF